MGLSRFGKLKISPGHKFFEKDPLPLGVTDRGDAVSKEEEVRMDGLPPAKSLLSSRRMPSCKVVSPIMEPVKGEHLIRTRIAERR
jgi:hypothetical protein